MNNIIGQLYVSSIFFILLSFIIFFYTYKFSQIKYIILIGFTLRLFFIILDSIGIHLPDSQFDTAGFQFYARLESFYGFENALEHLLNYGKPLIYIGLTAIIYSIFGENIFIIFCINIFLGISSIILVWLISNLIFRNSKISFYVTLFYSLTPTVLLYSILPSREVIISFLIIFSIYLFINWFDNKKLIYFISSLLISYLNLFFHSPLILLTVFYLLVYISYYLMLFIRNLFLFKFDFAIFLSLFLFLFLMFFFKNEIYTYVNNIPYLDSVNFLSIQEQSINSLKGNLSFPDYLIPYSYGDFILKIPMRIFYFLYSPFLNQISNPSHLLGIFDSFIFIFLTFLLAKNYKEISKNHSALILFLIFIILTLLYSQGTGNAGTAIRHRSKFISILIILSLPFMIRRFIK